MSGLWVDAIDAQGEPCSVNLAHARSIEIALDPVVGADAVARLDTPPDEWAWFVLATFSDRTAYSLGIGGNKAECQAERERLTALLRTP